MTWEQWKSPLEQERRRGRWQAAQHLRRFQKSKAAAEGMTWEQWQAHKAALAQAPTENAARLKAYRATPRGRAVMDRASAKQRKKKLDLIHAFKQKPCQDCGGKFHPEAMEFDHRDGETKSFSISYHGRRVGGEALLAEIAKCDLVCANCHRVRTARRRAGLPAVLPESEYMI